ncbi:reticulophagy regulator 2-like isoform X2 [Tubulanus polymorphus]|uniref:reticulophagy regulator 2-like isoform X2 n=1 Tax=Tubulanus polymorphus TaxID=672921 RepID=UPI003DA450BC
MHDNGDDYFDKLVLERRARLTRILNPMESLITRVQSVLVWEKPWISTTALIAANILFWIITHTSYRFVYIMCMTALILIISETWKKRIWPEIKVPTPEDEDKEGWTAVHPRLMSVPELCHYIAELWTTGTMLFNDFWKYRREHPAKFCVLTSIGFTILAVIGHFISGIMIAYITIMSLLLWPCVAYNSLLHKIYMKFEPMLMQLEYSMKINRRRHRSTKKRCGDEVEKEDSKDHVETDTDSELGEFCPSSISAEATAALARAITDSEDERASSRSQSPELEPRDDVVNDIENDTDLEPFMSELALPSYDSSILDVTDSTPPVQQQLLVPRTVTPPGDKKDKDGSSSSMHFKETHFKESSSSEDDADETLIAGLNFPDLADVPSETGAATEKAIMAASYAGSVVSKTIGTVMTGTISGISKIGGAVVAQVSKKSDSEVPSALEADPSAGVADPSASVADPSAGVVDPSAGVVDPSAGVVDPSASATIGHSNTADSDLADFEVLDRDELDTDSNINQN